MPFYCIVPVVYLPYKSVSVNYLFPTIVKLLFCASLDNDYVLSLVQLRFGLLVFTNIHRNHSSYQYIYIPLLIKKQIKSSIHVITRKLSIPVVFLEKREVYLYPIRIAPSGLSRKIM